MMSELIPRFEFRTFAQTFGLVAGKIRRYSVCHDIGESAEQYLVSADVEDQNVKVRDGRLEIKRLVEQRDRLERWEPVAGEAFPVAREFLRATLFPALHLREAKLGRAQYSRNDLLDAVVWPHQDVWQACVCKRRFRFAIDNCATEIDELLINGAAICSVAVESEDAGVVLAVIDKLGLAEYENINYPRAIRRIMGLEPLPNEDSYYG
jgi:hypothetical protein